MNHREISDLVRQLKELGAKLPGVESLYPLEEATFAEPSTNEEIAALEAKFGAKLQPHYQAFLELCGGFFAMDFFNGYALHSPSLVARQLDEGRNFSSVCADGSPVPSLPIGSNGGGDLFFLVIDYGVWRISHEILPTDGEPVELFASQWGVNQIGNTFVEFLELMVADWAHFITASQFPRNYICG